MPYPPEPDEGQPGLVLLSTGAYGYRYIGSDDVIIMKMPPAPVDEKAET
ncbi:MULTISPECIES: hypothetical protein [Williamsia]|jgi:hypothetical protein|uniref:Uncharacterized protein n=1 Tax=Williamsia limnetica TaxID=882452 RepID=A0A318REM5_WILLI|nr:MULTISPECIES: hypothetical protein [Williamsia]PYE12501.1 hypothetical protein DFR67_12285 [Williamsia limnetica]